MWANLLAAHSLYLLHPHRALLMLPLCLSVAIVYKTTRCATVREIPLAALLLWITLVVGMYAVGVGVWLLYALLS